MKKVKVLLLAVIAVVLVLALSKDLWFRYSPMGLNRTFWRMGYAGRSPEELEANVLAATKIDEICAPLQALSQLELHYSADEEAQRRALECVKRLLVKCDDDWGQVKTPPEFLKGVYSPMLQLFLSPPETKGEITKAALFHCLAGLRDNNQGIHKTEFRAACQEIFRQVEPPVGSNLRRNWERWSDPEWNGFDTDVNPNDSDAGE